MGVDRVDVMEYRFAYQDSDYISVEMRLTSGTDLQRLGTPMTGGELCRLKIERKICRRYRFTVRRGLSVKDREAISGRNISGSLVGLTPGNP
jgi:hypothetical protein